MCRPPASRPAAEIVGTAATLVSSTCLQGAFSTSPSEATASAVQANNLHLIRGFNREARRDRVPDERAAERAEHARVRRQWRARPASGIGTTPHHVADRRASGTSIPSSFRTWAPPTYATQIFRPSSSRRDSLPVDHRRPTRRLDAGSCAGTRIDPRQLEAPFVVVLGWFPDRDHRVGRPGPAGGDVGPRRRAASPTSIGPCICAYRAIDPPGEARSDLDMLPRLCPPDGLPRQAMARRW